MPPNTSPIFGLTPKNVAFTILPAGGTTKVDVFTAGASGGKCSAINVCSDDTATVNMQVFYHNGTAAFLLGTVPVPTLSGANGVVAAVNLLNPLYIPGLDQDGELLLPTGHKLQVAPLVAVTAAKTVNVVGMGYDY